MKYIRTNKQAGFTLIELVIVIVILGVLAAIIIQKFNQLNDDVEAANCKANQYKIENIALKIYSEKAIMGSLAFPENLIAIKSEFKNVELPGCPSGGTYSYSSSYGTITCDHYNHTR